MLSASQMDIQTVTDSNLEPLKLNFEAVRFFSSPHVLLRSTMTIQSLELGTLEQEQYRYVARRTAQSQKLFRRHLHRILEGFPQLRQEQPKMELVSLPIYSRMLKKGTLAGSLFDELSSHPRVSPESLCVEVSADILFEDLEPLLGELERVKDLGVKIAVWEVGDPFCPLLRLRELPYDYLILDQSNLALLNEDRKGELEALCSFLHQREKTRILLPGLPDPALSELAEQVGCDGWSLAPDAVPISDEEGDA